MKRSNKHNGYMRSVARRIANLRVLKCKNKYLNNIQYEGKVIY